MRPVDIDALKPMFQEARSQNGWLLEPVHEI